MDSKQEGIRILSHFNRRETIRRRTLAVLCSIVINDNRLSKLRSHMDARFDTVREKWRAELHRVEELLDARLKHVAA